jgi:arylsulfatase
MLGLAFALPATAQDKPPADAKLNRTSLPIPEPDYPHSTVLDARDAKAPPRFEVKAPAGAPNVIVILIDDMGFGMPSAFGCTGFTCLPPIG